MRKAIALLSLGVLITSCAPGGGQAPLLQPNPLPNAPREAIDAATATGTVKVTIVIPKKVFLRSHYVSPSTHSIVITVAQPHHKRLLTIKHNLGRGVKGCKNQSKAVVCSFKMQVAAGKDRFTAVTYDRPDGKGNELSGQFSFAHRVKAGKTTRLPLALAGITRSLSWQLLDAEDSAFETGDSTHGFQLAGLDLRAMVISPLDADGNIILGPGSPKLSLSSGNTDDIEVTPEAGSANTFLLTPHKASVVKLTASAKFLGLATHSTVTLSIQSVLYVANHSSATPGGSVTVYVPWSDAPVETITDGIDNPGVLTVDGFGDVWVGNDAGAASGAGSITEYRLGSTTPERTISGITRPSTSGRSLAVDISGDLYCACNKATEVDEFTPDGGSTPSRTLTTTSSPTGISTPISVVTDSSGNAYVANLGSNAIGVSVFAPGTGTTPFRKITDGINGVTQLAMDRFGYLYALNSSANPNTVTGYAPGATPVSKTFDSSGDSTSGSGLAVDRSGNVYLADSASPTNSVVVQFAAASSAAGTGTRTLIMHAAYIYATTVDSLGNVYVPLSNSSQVLVYPPGTSTTASRTLTNGIDRPWDVVTWP